MRITNKIMQRNNLANINTNKIYQDTLSNKMSTQKKVARPSDDPVVAIRALRLRSNVTEVTQYYSKNIPDAESWLKITEDALKNHSQVLTNMITQCTKGANGDLTATDRQIILEQMQALSNEIYSTANADYAGRYVFTGYRTDLSLSFIADETKNYEITEQLHTDNLDMVTKVSMEDMLNLNESNYKDGSMNNIQAVNMQSVDVYRIRLAYNDCTEGVKPSISFTDGTGANIQWKDTDIQEKKSYENPYVEVANDPDAIIYVPDTGEILLGKNKYDQLMSVKDNVDTTQDESEIRVTYEKKNWKADDLRPEHYFACKDKDKGIDYNPDYLTGGAERQDVEYDIGFNQTIRVNSTADECFQHGIGRTVDDLSKALEEVAALEKIQTKLQAAMDETTSESDKEILQTRLDALDKALALSKDKAQKMFEKGITTFQNYLNDANLSITNCGTRSSKLELVKNRMQNQKTTFETLKSENEDVDITEVAIELNSAELTYEAALMATGKVMQSTLLNYI